MYGADDGYSVDIVLLYVFVSDGAYDGYGDDADDGCVWPFMCVQPMMLMMDVIQWYEKCDGADDGYGVHIVLYACICNWWCG